MEVKKRNAILHLARGRSITGTAKRVGATRQSGTNWMKEESFISELERERRNYEKRLLEMYEAETPAAFKVLKQLMNDPHVAPKDRIRAAVEITKEAHRLNEFADFKKRLEELEELAQQNKSK